MKNIYTWTIAWATKKRFLILLWMVTGMAMEILCLENDIRLLINLKLINLFSNYVSEKNTKQPNWRTQTAVDSLSVGWTSKFFFFFLIQFKKKKRDNTIKRGLGSLEAFISFWVIKLFVAFLDCLFFGFFSFFYVDTFVSKSDFMCVTWAILSFKASFFPIEAWFSFWSMVKWSFSREL